ncbi:MAG: iron-containing alcohol dehydrogenase, partial [Pseudomonadota bacterium]
MTPFTFQTTKSILSEVGSTAKIGELMKDMGVTKIAFVTDKVILELGLADAAIDGIKKAGLGIHIIDDIVPDPPEAMILSAVEEAKKEGVDGVVSVGGGSSMDTAKLIAILVQSDQPIAEMYGVGLVKGGRLPMILAPTTAGTGCDDRNRCHFRTCASG